MTLTQPKVIQQKISG